MEVSGGRGRHPEASTARQWPTDGAAILALRWRGFWNGDGSILLATHRLEDAVASQLRRPEDDSSVIGGREGGNRRGARLGGHGSARSSAVSAAVAHPRQRRGWPTGKRGGGRREVAGGDRFSAQYSLRRRPMLWEDEVMLGAGAKIGNPLLNYAVDTSATYSYLWSHGIISDQTFRGVSRWCDFRFGYMGGGQVEGEQKVEKDIKRKRRKEKRGCTSFLGSARDEMGSYINIYDVTSDVCPPPSVYQAILIQKLMGLVRDEVKDVCVDHEISRYLNQKLVQQVLHANVTSLPYPWEACSSIVDYSANDQLADIIPLLVRLVKKRLPVWIFSGDQDSVVPLTGTRSQIAKLAQHVNMKPREKYQPWYANGQVGGWYEAHGDGRVLYATVRGASHMAPYTQPERALVLFTSFVGGGRNLPSHP